MSGTELLERPATHRLATVFAILVLIFCFIYFFELASFPFSLDEEWAALRKNPAVWIGQGRWGSFLIEKYVLSQPSIPVLPQMMFGFSCAATFLMILHMVGRDNLNLRLPDYASFVIFCAFPTWFYIIEFSSNIGAVAIGLFAGISGVYLAFAAGGKRWRDPQLLFALFVSSLLGAFAISTYQTLLFCMCAACAGIILARSISSGSSVDIKYILKFAFFLLCSTILYLMISNIFKYYYQVIETYTYIFFNTRYFLNDPLRALLKTLHEAVGFYGISDFAYHSPVWAIPVLLATGIVALLFDGQHGVWNRLALVVGASAMILVPFALNPFFPDFVLGRTMVATAMSAWFLSYIGLNSPRRTIRWLANAALVLSIVQIVYLQNKNQASSYFLAKHDLLVATSIYDRLGNAPGFQKGVQYPMAVFGGREFRSAYSVSERSNANASFFGPYLNNNFRVRAYLRIIGLEGLRPMTDDEMDKVIVRLSQMPIWPAAGSVILENGNLLVRLSKEPGPTDAASLARVNAAQP
ncbi:MAG: glucosyltransferase domain-containing protein [Rhizobiaceae bacterium]